jgi:hypothetical protein
MRSLCLICVEAPSARRIFGKARMDRDCDLWGAESHEQCPHFAVTRYGGVMHRDRRVIVS